MQGSVTCLVELFIKVNVFNVMEEIGKAIIHQFIFYDESLRDMIKAHILLTRCHLFGGNWYHLDF